MEVSDLGGGDALGAQESRMHLHGCSSQQCWFMSGDKDEVLWSSN